MKALILRSLMITLCLFPGASLAGEQKRDIRGVALGMSASEALRVLGSECHHQDDRIVCKRSKVDGSQFDVYLTVVTEPQLVWRVSYTFQTTQSHTDVARLIAEAYGAELNLAACESDKVVVNAALTVEVRRPACVQWWALVLTDRSIEAADLELKERADFKPVPKF